MFHRCTPAIFAAFLPITQATTEAFNLTWKEVDDDDVSLLQVSHFGYKAAVHNSTQGQHVSPSLVQAAHRMSSRRAAGPREEEPFSALAVEMVAPAAFVNATDPQKHTGAEPFCTGSDPEQQKLLAEGCRENHFEDWYRPIPVVAKEHPGASMFCHLGTYAYATARGSSPCVGAVEKARRAGNYFVTGTAGRLLSNKGPRHHIHYDGGSISTTNDLFGTLFDDMYCHANGWFQNQGIPYELVRNSTALEEVSAKHCRDVLALFPESDLSLPYMSHLMQSQIVGIKQTVLGVAQKAPSKHDMQRHAAVNCALGGVAMEISYCLDSGCMQADGYIGRGSMCAGPVAA